MNKYLTTVLLIIIIISCKKESSQTDNIFKFKDYVNSTTKGVISASANIEIGLVQDVATWKANEEVNKDYISISPKLKGKLYCKNTHHLTFIPDHPLKPDTEYIVSLKLNKIYSNVPSEFKTFTFKFKTIQPNFSVITNNLQSYSRDWQYVNGVIKLADISALDDVKQIISAEQDGKDLSISWLENTEKSSSFEFKIDSIHRKLEDSEILISWSGKPINAKNKGKETLFIPGINNFTVVNAKVVQSPEQHLSLNFSDPLKKQQNFDGLVTIQNTKTHQFIVDGNVLKIYPQSRLVGNLRVNVYQGITNTEGLKLKTSYSELLSFEELKPQVRLITKAGILPNSNDLKFNFEAVNLKAVDVRIIKIFEDNVLQFLQDENFGSNNSYSIKRVGRRIAKETINLIDNKSINTGQWKAYSIDLSQYFTANPGAIYRVELSYNKSYSLFDCTDNDLRDTNVEDNDYYYEDDYYENENSNSFPEENADALETDYWDNLTYSYRRYTYNWRQQDNPCHDAYYNDEKIVSCNLIASNLGIIVKRGSNNAFHFAVTNLLTTNPIKNAQITLYNYQQQPISSATTDSEGFTIIDADANAYFALVNNGANTTYIKLNEGNSLSLSKFDVSGKILQKGIKGYIYGERGVWRPGDSLYLTFVLNDNANKLPQGHPVKMEVTDANGKLAYRSILNEGLNNVYRFTVPTATEDKTGNWNAKVSVGGASFYKTLKVETIKPNRLKLKIAFEDDILSNTKPLESMLHVNWLHGAPAKHVKAEIKAKFVSTTTHFKNYKDYIFNDPTRSFYPEEFTVFEGNVNDKGVANINKTLSVSNDAPGMLNVSFLTRAFEAGGDFSIDVFSKPFAPYNTFVGMQSPKENGHSYFTDQNHSFNIVTVNKEGKPVKRNNLEISVFEIKWRWWWSSSYDNLSSYQSNTYHKPFMTKKINTNANGKASFNLNIPDSNSGRYLIRINDPEGGHATGRTAYFYKNWWNRTASSDKEAAKMLVFSSNKTTYTVGETANITFPSGTEGRALISVENGTEVVMTKWVKTQKGETTATIPIRKEMTPNVFINISLLQPHAVTENDLPIRLYGVIPIMVEDANTHIEPQINMPDVLRPKQNITVSINEKNNSAMTYTLAVVDEGLLDLTRFKTPNAWSAFYARQALGVKTWDVFDQVVGAYSGSIDQVFEIGGDGSIAEGKKKKANRFKPVVMYLGPFELKSGQTNKHNIKIPNYIGSVRTMVIASNSKNAAYGSAEKTTTVKKPLMVLATLPRKLSPGEKVTLPVSLFAMEKKIKTVNVKLNLSSGIHVVGNNTQTISFNKPDEKMVYFELDVSKAKGINTVEVIASGHGEKATYKVEIDVENPNPFTNKINDVVLNGYSSKTLNFSTFGVTGTNTAEIEFSSLPPMDFTGRLKYLIRYPHGCLEQTTSSVFPQLFLSDIFDLTADKKQSIDYNIKKGINRLANFQRSNGGLSYWSGDRVIDDWGTSYAGHFMIEAKHKGYLLPLTFMSNWLRYQKQAAKAWRPRNSSYRNGLTQAYRLYTLALAGAPDLASMNRLKAYGNLSNDAKWRLAAAYAIAGQKEAAKDIASKANIDFDSVYNDYYTYGSSDRNRAMALETMVILGDSKKRSLAEYIAKRLSSNVWMSTQTTAYSLLAMAKMVKQNGGKDLQLNYTINGKASKNIQTQSAVSFRTLNINDGDNTLAIKNKKNNVVYVRLVNSGKLPLGKELEERRGLNAAVNYKDIEGKNIAINKLQQGQDFIASITISNQKSEAINNVALTQIFPSGWEIINTRFTDFGNATSNQANYTDIKDDRVSFYFNLSKKGRKNDSKTFNVMLNAAYLGTYYLPGTQAEAMYDNDYLVRTKGKWITVNQ